MEEFLAFFSFYSCPGREYLNLTLVSFPPSQDSESHQTTSRQWLCRSPCGATLRGSTCSCKQTTLASTPSSLQTGREAGSCEQAPPLPAGLLCTAEGGQPGSCAECVFTWWHNQAEGYLLLCSAPLRLITCWN